jgi:hypothetical protein
MLAYLILVLAALSRLLPHALHGVGMNITATGAGLLYFGSRRSRKEAAVAVVLFAATDIYLTRVVFAGPFHPGDYLLTWLWYAAVCLLGHALLRRTSLLRVAAGVLCSATSFFLLSNLSVWLTSGMYPHTAAGLSACYALALPFYGNDLVSTSLVATVLFGLPALLRLDSAAAEPGETLEPRV